MSQAPLFTGVIVDDATQRRKVRINRYVRGLDPGDDKTTLNGIASRLGIPPTRTPDLIRGILIEIGKRARDKTSMDELSTLLKLEE